MSNVTSQPVAIVSYVFLVLTWIAVLLRCFVRIRIVKLFGIDDFLMVAALVRLIQRPLTSHAVCAYHLVTALLYYVLCLCYSKHLLRYRSPCRHSHA